MEAVRLAAARRSLTGVPDSHPPLSQASLSASQLGMNLHLNRHDVMVDLVRGRCYQFFFRLERERELRAWIQGWSLLIPTGLITLRTSRLKFASCGANSFNCPWQIHLLGSLPRCNLPRLGEPCGHPPAGDSWRPRNGGLVRVFISWALLARVRSASAGVIVVELVSPIARRTTGRRLSLRLRDVKNSLRLVRIPGLGGMPLNSWRLG